MVFTREDRLGFWINYNDAAGQRRRRKVGANTMEQAKIALSAERVRAEAARSLGFAPSTEVAFAEVAEQYLNHQKVRISLAN